jgi:flagellar basal body-associated protein FliL
LKEKEVEDAKKEAEAQQEAKKEDTDEKTSFTKIVISVLALFGVFASFIYFSKKRKSVKQDNETSYGVEDNSLAANVNKNGVNLS